MIVDRPNRDALVAAINRYLDGETTAFKFDDEIFSIKSDDPTISHVVCQLWFFYDDCKDHKVQLSKEAWDYFQRLILVLQSDAHIEFSKRRRWDFTQLIALAALMLFVYEAVGSAWGTVLAVAIPFGIVSIAISWWRTARQQETMDKNQNRPHAVLFGQRVASSAPPRAELQETQVPARNEAVQDSLAFGGIRHEIAELCGLGDILPAGADFQVLPITKRIPVS